VWCPEGDDWYCAKNCKGKETQNIKPDAKGCYDKGEHGVWCPRGDTWQCVKNCKDEEEQRISSSNSSDTKDCYFDPECHKLVDWSKIRKIKSRIFARLLNMREKQNPEGVKPMMQKIHAMLAEARMPDDRADYILAKWVKSAYPEVLREMSQEIQPDARGCYDKGADGVWCPRGDAWYCLKNCKDEQKRRDNVVI